MTRWMRAMWLTGAPLEVALAKARNRYWLSLRLITRSIEPPMRVVAPAIARVRTYGFRLTAPNLQQRLAIVAGSP